jgi:hypothetical protein
MGTILLQEYKNLFIKVFLLPNDTLDIKTLPSHI